MLPSFIFRHLHLCQLQFLQFQGFCFYNFVVDKQYDRQLLPGM